MTNIDINNIALVITGCIQPSPDQELAIKDKNIRLKQYIESIVFYVDNSVFTKIIFCENSNCHDEIFEKLKIYATSKNKAFEHLPFQGDEEIVKKHSNKGCGEDEIMCYVFNNSYLISSVNTFFKVTGRLKLVNINDIVMRCKLKNNYFLRYIYGGYNWLDTRFYLMPTDYYLKNVIQCYKRTGNYALPYEQVYFYLIKQYRGFAFYPMVQGVSGGNNHIYDNDNGLEFTLYNALCRLGVYNMIFPVALIIKNVINKIKKILK